MASVQNRHQMMELLFREQDEITITDIKKRFPDIPEQTLFSRIRALEKENLVVRVQRGRYVKGSKPRYSINFTPLMFELNALLTASFTDRFLCISTDGKNTLVETDKTAVQQILFFLRERYPNVFSFKEASPYLPSISGGIIVKPLITDAPLLESSGLNTSSLEKRLVDIVADKKYFHLGDQSILKEYQRALEVYPILTDRLLRYAGRRGVKEEIMVILGHLNEGRKQIINKLQRLLTAQPIMRAWLFGSWSRMEENAQSDIDLLVDYVPDAHISLLDHAGIQLAIEDDLGIPVDLVSSASLLPFAKESVEKDKYLIYERSA